ncbi:NAD(P)-binding protein [Guyanagaster necrorhizus]|uniref:NAD(P)-binding protein n=1 Tax=Guyanagaster necrorhizus TaxID=856835 RepID=A0A9P7VVY7_9AGAR|nr:NAD(P)-binding protein [Guyanagaster necrorhizus MCA 3950]KAG7446876.1 NAD(P)-binding protein [Guyanagaster necrorhizus MCA 3950]
MSLVQWATPSILSFFLILLYIRDNDRKLKAIPARAAHFSPVRWSPKDVERMASECELAAPSIDDQLPPKTGRRYIVVGGAGFLGGWIVLQLLKRGEDPKCIRILDIRPPKRLDLLEGKAKDVNFIQVDISDKVAVDAAFSKPWPDDDKSPISVFNTAANIRFYERHASLIPLSAKVNVQGPENIIDACRKVGVSILVHTSSGSVAVHSSRFLLWPWQEEPRQFVQVINDDDELIPKAHQDFFSNYGYTKRQAEVLVRGANDADGLRTGCLRPGNGIFGAGGDMLCGAYLVRKSNPTWIQNIVSSFVYVENCAVAHLLYEQRLIESPNLGGQAFCIADPGLPPTYGDVYTELEVLDGEVSFPHLSPTFILLLAYFFEFLYLTRYLLNVYGYPFLASFIPNIGGSDLVNLQPSLYNLTMVHLIFDDSRARLSPDKGGLGYKGAFTTFEGLYKTAVEHRRGLNRPGAMARSDVAGVSFKGMGFMKAQRGVGWLADKIKEETGVDPVEVLASS